MRLKKMFWMAMLVVTLSHSHALACTCLQSTPFDWAIRNHVVFEGVVENIKKVPVRILSPQSSTEIMESQVTFFKVSKWWKGKGPSYLGMTNTHGFCGGQYDFVIGKSYLVFADGLSRESFDGTRYEYPEDILLQHYSCKDSGALLINESEDLSLWLQAKLLFASLF